MTGIELFTIGSYIVTLGDVLLVAGAGTSALGALSQAQSASTAVAYNAQIAGINAQMAERNAQAAEQQATQAIAEGEAEAERQRLETRRRLGSARAIYGASGVDVFGSPLDVLSESAAEGELDALILQYQGSRRAQDYLTRAADYRNRAVFSTAQGRLMSWEADQLLTQGYWNAGSTLLTAGIRFGDRYSRTRAPTISRFSDQPTFASGASGGLYGV
jgi:hypothetical protein